MDLEESAREGTRENCSVVIVSPPKSHLCYLGQEEECGVKDCSLNWRTGGNG